MADSPDFRLLEQHADVWHLWVETVLGVGQSQGDAERFSESRSRALGALTLAAGEVREVRKGSRWALFGAAAVFGLIAGAGAFGGFVAHANITASNAPLPASVSMDDGDLDARALFEEVYRLLDDQRHSAEALARRLDRLEARGPVFTTSE